MIRVAGWGMLGGSLLWVLLEAALDDSQPWHLGAAGVTAGLAALTLGFNARGRTSLASRLLVASGYIGVTLASVVGGVSSPAYAGYLLLVITAALLLGAGEALASGGIVAATVLATAWLSASGVVPLVPGGHSLFGVAGAALVFLTVAGALGLRATGLLRTSLRSERFQQKELAAQHQQLEALDARLRLLAEFGHDLITEAAADGRFVYLSPNHRDVLGWDPDAMVGELATDYVNPDERPTISEAELHTGRFGPIVFRVKHADGSWRWLEVNGLYRSEEDGRSLTVARDVTDRIQAEQGRKLREAQTRHAKQMESLGRLAGGISHEFNNLMTIVTVTADLLRGRLANDERGRVDLDRIRVAAEQATDLTRSLLAFSRPLDRRPELLDLASVLADLERLVRPLLGEPIELRIRIGSGGSPLWVEADRSELGLVVLNLLVHARDAISGSGWIDVELRAEEGSPEDGPRAVLAVRDSGPGMEAGEIERLLEDFSKPADVSAASPGLETAFAIVQRAGGQIRGASIPGEGTSVEVWLPRRDRVGQSSDAVRVEHRARGSETILLVEDAEPVRSATAEALTGLGYRVLQAASSSDAMLVAKQWEGSLELLVSDVVLPGMAGPELAEALRADRPSLRVLYFTGYAPNGWPTPDDSVVLRKPFTAGRLAGAVRGVLDGALPGSG